MRADEKRTRQLLETRSDGNCEVCGGPGHSLHHRVNRSAGGKFCPSNALWLCGNGVVGCHGRCTVEVNWARRLGYHVAGWDVPAEVPVLRWGVWVLLGTDGQVQELDPGDESPQA